MDPDFRHGYPPVFMVDREGLGLSSGGPGLVPCWTFPPPRVKSKRGGCGECCAVTVLLLMLLLVLAALGLGAYQILKLQTELAQLRQDLPVQTESPSMQKQVGVRETHTQREPNQAAHLTVRIEKGKQPKTLRWESRHGRAYTLGVAYLDGGLQVNETGLYFVYSQVEYMARECPHRESLIHTVFKRHQNSSPRILLEGHREGYCQLLQAGYWSASSYVGAVLQLDRLDRLFVNVSRPDLLSHNFNANFFGVFKI